MKLTSRGKLHYEKVRLSRPTCGKVQHPLCVYFAVFFTTSSERLLYLRMSNSYGLQHMSNFEGKLNFVTNHTQPCYHPLKLLSTRKAS